MKKPAKWVVSVGVAVLIASLIFNWLSFRTIRGFTAGAEWEFMQGWGAIRLANQEYQKGDKTNAEVNMEKGVGYLKASSYVMNQMGVSRVMGIGMYVEHARSYLLSNSSSSQTQGGQHYEHVLSVLNNAFMPFGTVNPGSINNSQLQQAVSKVYQAMTPQERNQYEGWGP